MIPSVQYPVLKVPACGVAPAARSSAFVLGARLNNTRTPGPCPELFRLRRYLHILHTYGVRKRLEGALRPSLYMDGPRRPGQGTLHCAAASRDGGRRNARHAAFPAPGRPIRVCAAARHAILLLSAGISTGSGAWTRRRWVEPRRRERGALPDMAALAAAGHRALGSMGWIPAKRFAAFALCLLAIRWPIGRCVAEQCPDSQCALMANRQTAGL